MEKKNWEDEFLKSFFDQKKENKNGHAPKFESMWQEVQTTYLQKKRRKRFYKIVAVAASLALLILTYFMIQKNDALENTAEEMIANFQLPATTFLSDQKNNTFTSISTWKSPTDFLLKNTTPEIERILKSNN